MLQTHYFLSEQQELPGLDAASCNLGDDISEAAEQQMGRGCVKRRKTFIFNNTI
jgi:hypothetical protein